MLGLGVFLHFETRKFGDNQFTVKLLPPPPRLNQESPAAVAPAKEGDQAADWAAVPADRDGRGVPLRAARTSALSAL